MKIDLATLTVASALQALYEGEFSALDLVEACLQKIAQLNPANRAFITPTPELAVQSALAADALLALRPGNLGDLALLGIPVGLKDLFDTAGIRTTGGSKYFSDRVPQEDASAVLKLKVVGAAIVGKCNTHEFALGVTGVNPHYGAVSNPYDPGRISGGSSSGSAVAVATGMCLAALGTDTGGSLRIPASLCGVVGFKPTRGKVSTRGVIPLSWNLDHVGTLTRTVADAAILLKVIAGYDPHDPTSVNWADQRNPVAPPGDVKNWRIALGVGEYVEACDPEIWNGIMEAGHVFGSLGVQVERVDLDWMADLAQANSRMTQADAAAFHRERLQEHPEWFGEDVRQRLLTGAALSSSEYVLARQAQTEGRRKFDDLFSKFDLIILPTTPIPAPEQEGNDAIESACQLTRLTSPFNLAGLPALSVPAGMMNGLPFGLQLVAGAGRDDDLLKVGMLWEEETSRLPGRRWPLNFYK